MDNTLGVAPPIHYQACHEMLEKGEAETLTKLLETLRSISATTLKDSGHGTRSVHAKSHGLLRAQLQVPPDLIPELAQGVFSKAGTWPVVIRFSTIPGDILDDNVSTPRGMAIKIIGVEGERLPGSEGATTQDFVLVNGPTFLAPNAKKFTSSLKLLAATTDKAPALKQALSTLFQGVEKSIEAVGGKSAALIAMGGHPETHVLGETFYSQVPILFGPYIAKISVVPASENLIALKNAIVDLTDKPNGLREAVIDFFKNNGAVWDVRVQLCNDIDAMPIEDASVPWAEELSPYITIAQIKAEPQAGWSQALSKIVDDGMAFNPWHGITAHRPLGSIMRVRKAAYEISSKFRAEANGITITEPKNLDNFPA